MRKYKIKIFSFEEIENHARKFRTFNEWIEECEILHKQGHPRYFLRLRKCKPELYNDIKSKMWHLKFLSIPAKDIWTKEQIILHAKNFKYRKEWLDACLVLRKIGHPNYLQVSYLYGFYDECISHFAVPEIFFKIEKKPRSIYVFEFIDNHAYVGVTVKPEKREIEHAKDFDSPVFKHLKVCQKYVYKIIKSNISDFKEARDTENFWIDKYKKNWKTLNRRRGGSLGFSQPQKQYSNEELFTIGKNFLSRTEWKIKDNYTRLVAMKRGIFDAACAHMVKPITSKETKEKISNGLKTSLKAKEGRIKTWITRKSNPLLKNGQPIKH